jgi:hypothetical protein
MSGGCSGMSPSQPVHPSISQAKGQSRQPPYSPSFFATNSFTACGLALPPVAFIT